MLRVFVCVNNWDLIGIGNYCFKEMEFISIRDTSDRIRKNDR